MSENIRKLSERIASDCREAEALLAEIQASTRPVRGTSEEQAADRLQSARCRADRFRDLVLAIRDADQYLVDATERRPLAEGTSRILHESLGTPSAWIALLDGDGGTFRTVGGTVPGGEATLLRRLARGDVPDCLALAVDRSTPVVLSGPDTCADCPTAATEEPFACLAQRIALGETLFGVLVVAVPRAQATAEEEQVLFGELAGDIASALQRIADRERRLVVEAALRERVKELHSLYQLNRIIADEKESSLERILGQAVHLLPEAWQFPEDTVGRIRWRGTTFSTGDFESCRHRLSAPIRTFGEIVGHLDVGYRSDHARESEGPFLLEERHLIDALAERLGRVAERKQTTTDLRWREEMFARTESLAHIGSWEWEIATDTVVWSKELFRIFGRDPADGPPPFADHDQLYPPEDIRRLRTAVEEAVTAGRPYSISLKAIRPSGEIRRCTSHGFPVVGEDGGIHRLVGFFRDDTERERAEEIYARVCEMATELICIADIDTATFRQVNPAFGRVLGYTEDELLSRPFLDFVHPDDRKPTLEVIDSQLKQDRPVVHFTNRYRCRDGTYRILEWNAHPVAEDRLTYSIAHDVTEQHRYLAALRESEEKYRLLADVTVDVIWKMDLDLNILYVNPACEAVFGRPAGEVVGAPFAAFCNDEDLARFESAVADVLADPSARAIRGLEMSVTHRDGHAVDVEISGRVVVDDEGRPVALQGSTRDISRRKRAERERADLEQQLNQSRRIEAVGRLAGGIAHDFNNLLTVITNYCDLLREEVADPERELVGEIRGAADRAAELTHQLLAFSRRQVIEPRNIDLNDSVLRVEKMLRRLIGEDVELEIGTVSDLALVRCDPGQAEQILFNLALNARDAMPGGGRLLIETANVRLDGAYAATHAYAVPGDYVMLAVSDTGTGMDEATRAAAFDPFFTTKERGKGTGLGLSTVYGIVKQHGGSIELYSEPGHGTTFKIYLPVAHAETPDAVAAPPAGPLPRGTETVLVVEDDDAVRRVTVHLLASLGYEVVTAANPDEAVAACARREGAIDLLLTDVIMPGSNGRECAARVAEHHPGVRVVFMSGYTENVIARQGVLHADTVFLQKPFSIDALAHRLRQALA